MACLALRVKAYLVIGLGYVGLPLAAAFGRHLHTIGFDVNPTRIQALRQGADCNGELQAARTKWNFLPFEPGLVGGHCIPVDPYYLTHKAEEVGYHPDVILAGRRINDAIGRYVARETVRLLIQAGKVVRGAQVLVLGLAFKEDVADARSTRVLELVEELTQHGLDVTIFDPVVGSTEIQWLGLKEAPNPFKTTSRKTHLRPSHQTNQTNQTNQINQINQMDQIDQINQINLIDALVAMNANDRPCYPH